MPVSLTIVCGTRAPGHPCVRNERPCPDGAVVDLQRQSVGLPPSDLDDFLLILAQSEESLTRMLLTMRHHCLRRRLADCHAPAKVVYESATCLVVSAVAQVEPGPRDAC